MIIPIQELIDDLRTSDEEFNETCEESPTYAMSIYLNDSADFLKSDFPEGKIFKFVKGHIEKGDGKDEEFVRATFLRKSDNVEFTMWVHDAGFIGPSTLSMSEFLTDN